MGRRNGRWAMLMLLSSGLLLPGACATAWTVLQTLGHLMYIVDALA